MWQQLKLNHRERFITNTWFLAGTVHLLLTITGTTAQEVVDGGTSLSPYPRRAVEVVEKEMRDLMNKYVGCVCVSE